MSNYYLICFYVIFTLSGFSGLIYESIWTHYLKLFLGHSAYAQTLVLAIFMGGMALGSSICSRYAIRWKNLFLVYAFAEGAVGLFALFFHPTFDHLIRFSYLTVIPNLNSPVTVTIFKWGISALLVLPPSILLGMTFPLMSAAILRDYPDRPGTTLSFLYFTNSIGAAVGVLSSGFVLISQLGLPGTIRLAGAINILLALIIWTLTRKGGEDRQQGPGHAPVTGNMPFYRLMLAASMITGIASFIYEIGWIRMLSLVLGSSTHAFELMLSAFLLGLASGGLWIKRRIDHVDPVKFLVWVQVVMGALALATLPVYGNTFMAMEWLLKTLEKTDAGYAMFNFASHGIALSIMMPATFCAGMTLPLITYSLIKDGHGEKSIGAVYAANTVGAIIGVFFAIHIGLPYLGLKGLIIAGALLDIGLGLMLAWRRPRRTISVLKPAVLTIASLICIASTLIFVRLDTYLMASGVYRDGLLLNPKWKIISHRDGKTATVSVVQSINGGMSIRTNGKVDAGIMMDPLFPPYEDESNMVLLAAIPMTIHPGAKTAATIGFGSGLTSNTLLSDPLIKEVDTIEIERNMVEGARNFGPRVERVFKDPRSNIYIEDAKTFFSTHGRQYDIIISEPSNPWVSGVAGLFSTEFYGLMGRYLKDDGLFVQWIQLYEIDFRLVVSILKAISANFADYVIYASNDGDLIVVATNGKDLSAPEPGIFMNPVMAQEMRRVGIGNIQDIEVRKVGNKMMFENLIRAVPVSANSDYYPFVDQNASRARFLHANAQEIVKLVQEPLPLVEMLSGSRYGWRETDIEPTPYFKKSNAIYTAMSQREYILHGTIKSESDSSPMGALKESAQLRELFSECRPFNDNERQAILFNSLINIVPYLTKYELESVWKWMDSSTCGSSLNLADKMYIELFKSVGDRDADAMAKTASIILENEKYYTQAQLRYLVAVGMLGYLANGHKEESLKLWTTYRYMIWDDNSGILFPILESISEHN